ncbi:MAG TPA: ATP-binding cassette domain-containing protein [Gaiellaceae bacterium]|nr:ATP-binding cassette domain-containing protein [Gaiellaceae bacterium]
MSPEPLAACRGLSKTYSTPAGGIEALHAVDAELAAGEVTAVVGPSGSGKSTLLRALAGLDRPTAGSLVVGGAELAGAPPAALRRHRRERAAYVAQKPADNLVPHLRLRDQDDGRAVARLVEFGLGHRLGSRPAELSGGEQARAAFALALARGTPLVLADEPTAELDRGSAGPLLEAIRAHAGGGVAFVVATHDEDVVAIADRVLRLDRGRVVAGEAPAPPGRAPAGGAGETVLAAQGVAKAFRRGPETIRAVVDGTLDLARGEVAALLGRSGSGKSTLLALLAGLQEPASGAIRYSLGAGEPSLLAWRELAFLPQRFGLLPELSIRENVELPARLAGELGRRAPEVDALLERLGLAELAGRPPHETSIGQQQRAALARALVLSPAVLLADEPTSHQDAGWRDAVWRLLGEAAAAGTACLVATHEEDVARFATRVWTIDGGATRPRCEG